MDPRTNLLVQQLKALGDSHRLRLVALCRQGECSVGELTEVIGQSQPRVSQHLKQLCEAGLLERFRDGRHVYYRSRARGDSVHRRLLALVPESDARFAADAARLRRLRSSSLDAPAEPADAPEPDQRSLHRAILECTVTTPVGDLLDIGCGRGRLLKLLASRANRAIGVDIDAGARNLARAELMLAGLPNCSLRKGDMYRLPFGDAGFDTIILDDVLRAAGEPVQALLEARRLLRPGGRLLVLFGLQGLRLEEVSRRLAGWGAAAGFRLAPPRTVPEKNPRWLLSIATLADSRSAAA